MEHSVSLLRLDHSDQKAFSFGTYGHSPYYGVPFLFSDCFLPSFSSLIGRLIAVSTIDRLGTVGLKRYLGLNATRCAGSWVHLTFASAIASATAVSSATASVLLGSIAAGFTFSGSLESFGLVKLLLFNAESKIGTARRALDLLFGCHRCIEPRSYILF